MISAEQARSSYNKQKLLAEKFISKEIEPKIKNAMEKSKSVDIEGGNFYYRGDSFYFDKEYEVEYKCDITLTEEVIDVLRENGYKVGLENKTPRDERRNGVSIFTISWY